MIYAIHPRNFAKSTWIDAFKNSYIYTKFVCVGASLVMDINPAGFAKVMLGRFVAPLIQGHVADAFDNFYAINCTPPRSKAAVASVSFFKPFSQSDIQFYSGAMTCGFHFRLLRILGIFEV